MKRQPQLYTLYVSEFIGTALLLTIGLSIVIFNWGKGSIIAQIIPSIPERRLLTGFLFGCTGCAITLSPVGKISGAHINPAVSIAFWLRGKMKNKALAGYIISQMLGAVVGCLPLILWGKQGYSIDYANTVPGAAGIWLAFIGETMTTACLVAVIFIFVGSRKLRRFTPYTMPFLYAFMVFAETVYSGCSTNPARSFGPAVVSNVYTAYWVYLSGPLSGAGLVVVLFKWFRLHHDYPIHFARVAHLDQPSPQTE